MITTERFDAVCYLAHLTSSAAESPGVLPEPDLADPRRAIGPEDLPSDWRIEWEERAAIREYDGGQAREHAEAEALREIIERMKDAGVLISPLT